MDGDRLDGSMGHNHQFTVAQVCLHWESTAKVQIEMLFNKLRQRGWASDMRLTTLPARGNPLILF